MLKKNRFMCGTYEKQGRENQTKAQGEKGFSVERF